MRVLHVSAYYAPAFVYGGPPRSVHGLCRALRRAGADVQVFTTDANGEDTLPPEVTAAAAYQDVPVRYFPRTWPPQPIGSRPLGEALRAAVPGADLVHIHGLWNRVVWTAAREARRAGIPYVVSPRGMLEPAALAHRALRKRIAWGLVERATVEGAALLHATSTTEHRTLVDLRPAADVVLVPNGVDVPVLPPAGRRRPVIAFIGRLHPLKRLDLLVDAFARVHAVRPDAGLVIAGPDEASLRRPLTTRAGAAAAAITWAGPVDSAAKAALLAEAAALAVCSDSESFALSAAEAMAAAVPVVVTRTCPWPDVESHGAGYWVEQRADAIAEALLQVLDHPESARAMGARGRALIEQKYRWDVVARDLLQHYRRITSRTAAEPALAALA
jgi:glycosyltransferase involved in cell wall biosynthesis